MYFTQKVHFCQTLKKSIASISFFYYILCYFLCNCSCFCLVCLLFNVKISKHNRIGTQLACGYCYVTFPVVEVSSFKARSGPSLSLSSSLVVGLNLIYYSATPSKCTFEFDLQDSGILMQRSWNVFFTSFGSSFSCNFVHFYCFLAFKTGSFVLGFIVSFSFSFLDCTIWALLHLSIAY